MSEGYKTLLFAILVLVFLVILPSAWLIRRWRGRRRKERDLSELFGRPYSGPTSFEFRFESTHRDLLDAHAAVQPRGPGDRLVLISLGLFWLGCVVMYSPHSLKNGTWWKVLLLLGLGCAVIWLNLIKPLLEKRRIRKGNAPTQDIFLQFSDSGIHIESPALAADRSWDELIEFRLADKGVVVVFPCVTNWIPNRAFSGKDQRRAFAAYSMSKLREYQQEEME